MFSSSQYSFDTHSSSSSWNIIDLESGEVSPLTNDSNVAELIWLGSTDSGLLYINSTNANVPGGVELWVSDANDFDKKYVSLLQDVFRIVNCDAVDTRPHLFLRLSPG